MKKHYLQLNQDSNANDFGGSNEQDNSLFIAFIVCLLIGLGILMKQIYQQIKRH
jgi:hypothetical protein